MISMFKKKPVLEYESAIEFYPNIITPAKNHIPDWYKKIPRWKNNEIFEMGKGFNITLKHCLPFLDSLTVGYVITLSNDLYVKNNNGDPFITWSETDFPPKERGEVASLNLIPFNHYPKEFTWQTGAAFSIPLGFSMLITHPLNRHDLPFTTLSGIVDGGLVLSPTGNIPFYIKKDFEGIISAGTPIVQLIPYKQNNWVSKKTKGLTKKSYQHRDIINSLIYGWYKKTFWIRKKYN